MFRYRGVCAISCVCLFLTTACANLSTINRSTMLQDKTAKAVHLDVQQRLLIMNNLGRYCAEPSPDGLASYAGALGLSTASPASGSNSLSGSGQSNAASIGLRTQSITLMRDALYRMCESYANGAVGKAQVVTLLNRSQDLTAVILAVEQLTGAVSANQVALTGSSGAGSTAIALDNAKLLAEATAHEARLLARLDEAKVEKVAAKTQLDEAEASLAKANTTLTELEKDPTKVDAILKAKGDVAFEQSKRDSAGAISRSADARVELYQTAYDKAQAVTAEIAKTPNSSSASSTANTTGAAQFSASAPRNVLSKEATEAVATAVSTMVGEVLKKDYVLDSCLSVITSNTDSTTPADRQVDKDTRKFCRQLVRDVIFEKKVMAEARVEDAKRKLINKSTAEISTVFECITTAGKLDPKKRDQLFTDANIDGALTVVESIVTNASSVDDVRTMLAQNPDIRIAMASKVESSEACK